MKLLSPLRVGTLCLGSLVAFSAAAPLSPALLAQSQDNTSVAEAARKAKEQKKTAPKGGRVITEETLTLRPASADTGEAPPAGTVINTTPVMPGAETTTAPAKPAESADASAPPADPKKAEEQAAEIAKAKERLEQARSELDLMKRQFALDSESYYSQPDYTHYLAGRARLDEQQKLIDEKQASVQQLKDHLEMLIQEAGVSPNADQAPAPPKP